MIRHRDLLGGGDGAPAIWEDGRVRTYGELARAVDRFASSLAEARVEGQRVGLLGRNGSDYVVAALGLLEAGACLVPLAAESSPAEREELVRRMGLSGVLVLDGEGWNAPAAPARPIVSPLAQGRWYATSADALAVAERDFAAVGPAFIRFSSGTTGAAKGVVLSHDAVRARTAAAADALGLRSTDRVLWTLPMAHHFVASILSALGIGASIALAPESALADELLGAASASEATVLYAGPFQIGILAAAESAHRWDPLRLAVSTAAPLGPEVARDFLRRYGVPVSQAYGIIEAGLVAVNHASAAAKPEAVGRLAPGFAVEIRGESGAPVAPDVVGRVFVRGPGLLTAYLDPWRTGTDLLPGGWFETGDLGRLDPDGDLFLEGRTSTVINVGGMKCFPEEVERVLLAHPGVVGARVSARRHARLGSFAVAEIVPSDPADPPTGGALVHHCRQRLARYKVPLEFRMVPSLGETPSGKMRREGVPT